MSEQMKNQHKAHQGIGQHLVSGGTKSGKQSQSLLNNFELLLNSTQGISKALPTNLSFEQQHQ